MEQRWSVSAHTEHETHRRSKRRAAPLPPPLPPPYTATVRALPATTREGPHACSSLPYNVVRLELAQDLAKTLHAEEVRVHVQAAMVVDGARPDDVRLGLVIRELEEFVGHVGHPFLNVGLVDEDDLAVRVVLLPRAQVELNKRRRPTWVPKVPTKSKPPSRRASATAKVALAWNVDTAGRLLASRATIPDRAPPTTVPRDRAARPHGPPARGMPIRAARRDTPRHKAHWHERCALPASGVGRALGLTCSRPRSCSTVCP